MKDNLRGREFEILSDEKLRCTDPCSGKCSFDNSEGEIVCGVLTAPARTGTVSRDTQFDEMRVCSLLENGVVKRD